MSSQKLDKRTIISNHHQLQEFFVLADEIERALFTFESTANYAIMRVYQKNPINSEAMSIRSLSSDTFDNENNLLTHSEDHETVFLVYLCVFLLFSSVFYGLIAGYLVSSSHYRSLLTSLFH